MKKFQSLYLNHKILFFSLVFFASIAKDFAKLIIRNTIQNDFYSFVLSVSASLLYSAFIMFLLYVVFKLKIDQVKH